MSDNRTEAVETVDFRELMSTPLDSYVVEKVLLPQGHYFAEGTLAEHGQGGKNNNHFWAFYYHLTECGPDVDPRLLETISLKDYEFPRRPNPGYSPQGPSVFWITPPSLRAGFLRNFAFSCGFDTSARPLDEFIPEYRGTRLLVGITQEAPRNNPTGRKYNNVVTVTGTANPQD